MLFQKSKNKTTMFAQVSRGRGRYLQCSFVCIMQLDNRHKIVRKMRAQRQNGENKFNCTKIFVIVSHYNIVDQEPTSQSNFSAQFGCCKSHDQFHRRLLLKLDTQPLSLLLVEVFIKRGICTASNPLQYGTPPPQGAMPRLLQEQASRWCH